MKIFEVIRIVLRDRRLGSVGRNDRVSRINKLLGFDRRFETAANDTGKLCIKYVFYEEVISIDPNEHVYCTHCKNLLENDEWEYPYSCDYEDECWFYNIEDSRPFSVRPKYVPIEQTAV